MSPIKLRDFRIKFVDSLIECDRRDFLTVFPLVTAWSQ